MNESVVSHLPDDAPLGAKADPRGDATLALFGHDLRSALSDVVGGLRLVDSKTLDPLTRAQIDRVRASSEMLVRLLDHGLAVMLGGAPAVRPAHLDVQRFATDLDLRWSGRALEKGITFTMRKDPGLPEGLMLDRLALDRVLSILIGNAFKHAERGRVVCDMGIGPDGGLRMIVRDDGPGFPATLLDAAQPFQPGPERHAEPGSGMGLFIAADLVRELGGRLMLRNLVPSGAEAQVDLPLSKSQFQEPEAVEQHRFLDGKRVLIADDNPTSQAITARVATGFGAEVVVVNNGFDALERLEREAFDLLLVDMQMPRMTGLEVIRCLRQFPGNLARLPVIAVTAYGLPADRKAILAAGADDVLTKPLLCPQAFAFVVRHAMMTRPAPATVVQTAALLDPDHLHRLLDMAGPQTGRDLLDRLVSDLGGVQHGLMQAARDFDWAAIRGHSHVLISLAGAVGGAQLQSEAEALNLIGHRMDLAAMSDVLPGALSRLGGMIEAIRQIRQAHAVQAE